VAKSGIVLAVLLATMAPAIAQDTSQAEPPTRTAPPTQLETTTPQPPGQPEPTPSQVTPPVPTTPTGPVPVIPETQPLIPPPTVPSAPQRFLPSVTLPSAAILDFQAGITLSEEYTDNFNLTARDKQGNFRSSLSPSARLSINSAFTKGLIAYTFSPSHDSATDEIQYFQSLLGQVSWQATPLWRLTVADVFTRSDQPGDADRLGLRQQRQAFTSNTASLTSEYQLKTVVTRQFYRMSIFDNEDADRTTTHNFGLNATVPLYQTNSVTAGYDYLTSRTTSDNAGDDDDKTSGHQLTAAFTRQVSTFRSVGISTSYAFRDISGDTGDSDFQLWNASLFTNYSLPGRLTARSSLGVSGLRTGSGEMVGPNISTASSLTYQFARAALTLGIDRGFSETFSDGENFGVVETEGITASLSYSFTPSLSGTLNGFARRNRFTDLGGSDTREDDRSENWGGTLGFTWRLTRRLLLDLSYSYLNQKSDDSRNDAANNDYAENRVRASLGVSF
jgi:hypothetical protein